jgi:hypothetical protein
MLKLSPADSLGTGSCAGTDAGRSPVRGRRTIGPRCFGGVDGDLNYNGLVCMPRRDIFPYFSKGPPRRISFSHHGDEKHVRSRTMDLKVGLLGSGCECAINRGVTQ